jgi:uncharacterized glyoxalase superfamily protein PhnB
MTPTTELVHNEWSVIVDHEDLLELRRHALVFDQFTLILDAAAADSVATIGFNSADCDADCAGMAARGAIVLQPPQDRPYGARVAYIKGPGVLTIELEQVLRPSS